MSALALVSVPEHPQAVDLLSTRASGGPGFHQSVAVKKNFGKHVYFKVRPELSIPHEPADGHAQGDLSLRPGFPIPGQSVQVRQEGSAPQFLHVPGKTFLDPIANLAVPGPGEVEPVEYLPELVIVHAG